MKPLPTPCRTLPGGVHTQPGQRVVDVPASHQTSTTQVMVNGEEYYVMDRVGDRRTSEFYEKQADQYEKSACNFRAIAKNLREQEKHDERAALPGRRSELRARLVSEGYAEHAAIRAANILIPDVV